MATVRVLDVPSGVMQAGAATRGAFDFRNPIDLSDAPAAGAAEALPSGFELVDTIELVPDLATPLRALSPLAAEAEVEVAVEDGFEVVGLTFIDGVPQWNLATAPPAGAPTRDASGLNVRRLRVSVASQPDGTRGLLDGIAGKVVTHVLKFAARKAASALLRELITRHESDLREGPVVLRAGGVDAWEERDSIAGLAQPGDRVLVMVHGTFSSTRGSFGALGEGAGSPLPGWLGQYAAVIGFDHRTLSRTPRENADAIAAALRTLPDDVGFDIVGYSRGGLVVRELTERVFTNAERERVDCVIGVATTYRGTRLARSARWLDLIDRMSKLAAVVSFGAGATGVGAFLGVLSEGFGGLLAMVKALTEAALVDGGIPGLAAMDPGGDLVKELASGSTPGGQRYLCITSDFEPGPNGPAGVPAHLGMALADASVDGLFEGAANDLVVDNASTLGLPAAFPKPDHLAVPTAETVHHCSFFASPLVRQRLGDALRVFDAALPFGVAWNGGTRFTGSRGLPDGVGLESGLESLPAPGPVQLNLGADAPRAVEQGATFTVVVKVAREAVTVGEGGATTGLKAADPGLPLTIIVEPTRGCRLAPDTNGRVQKPVPAAGDPIELEFDVVAVDLGAACIDVRVRQGNDRLGAVQLTPQVRGVGRGDATRLPVADTSALDRGSASAHLLDVSHETVGGEHFLRFELRSPSNNHNQRYDAWKIGGDPLGYLTRLYARIEQDWAKKPAPAVFQQSLEGLGIELWEALLPPALRADLWKLKGKLPGLQVDSNESVIPWEMVRVSNPDDVAESAGFLAEWGLVRSLAGNQTPDALQLNPAKVVRPDYPGRLALPAAATEQAFLQQKLGATSLPTNPAELRAWFLQGQPVGVFHFAGHGQADEVDLRLVLAGPSTGTSFQAELLDASAFRTWPKFKAAPARPLVFINACRTGQTQMVLNSERSWARVFLGKGAGAVIAPLWAVGDGAASTFAETLYLSLQDGKTFADAVAAARQAAKAAGDATWLSYTVYATPHATAV